MTTYTTAGVDYSSYADLRDQGIALIESKAGDSINTDEDEIVGILIRVIATLLGDSNDSHQDVYDGLSVRNASGVQLDNLVGLVGVERSSAAYSTTTLTLTASMATTVSAGFRASTESGVEFETDDAIVFSIPGVGESTATCTVVGSNNAGIGKINEIKTTTRGITAVTNLTAAVPGRLRENSGQLRAKHTASVATSGEEDAASIFNAVSEVVGTSAVNIEDNDTNLTVDGVPPKNIRVSVIGGIAADIGAAIYYNKVASIPTYGTQAVSVYSATQGKSKTIHYDIAVETPIYISLNISIVSGRFPEDGQTLVRTYLSEHFNDFRIKQTVDYNALYSEVYRVTGIKVNTMYIGTSASPTGTVDITRTALQRAVLPSDDKNTLISIVVAS